jgi:hypothetical protein
VNDLNLIVEMCHGHCVRVPPFIIIILLLLVLLVLDYHHIHNTYSILSYIIYTSYIFPYSPLFYLLSSPIKKIKKSLLLVLSDFDISILTSFTIFSLSLFRVILYIY